MTLVLGIDPGTATTGYGLVRLKEDDTLETPAYGVLLTPAGMPPAERLLSLYRQLKEILLLHQPQQCAVEKLFFQKNVTTAISVGQARGVILLALAESGLTVQEYTPNEIKQAVAGYGSAGKRQVQEMVRMLLGLDAIPKPDDAADALAVAITALHTHRFDELAERNAQ
jgi:crossover junction endodeoxyribonuclease RuvC